MKFDNKNKLLVSGIILMVLVCYRFAIVKTLEQRRDLHQLRVRSMEMQDIPGRTALLARKNEVYDSILEQMDMGDNSLQNNLLRLINAEANKRNVKVMEFNRPHIATLGTNDLYTFSFGLNGNYTDILKIVHAVEQKGNFGKVAHIDLEKKKDNKTNKYSLGATVFVQHLK